VGIHPHDAGKVEEGDIERLKEMACEEKVVAIGETGLDYYRDLSPRGIQRKVFIEELRLARILKKPVVIHCRDAYSDLISIMRDHDALEVGGVIHCFSGNWEAAEAFLNMGFFISFAGNITYPKAEELREVLSKVPKDCILMETDSPFLTPQCYRGKRNEPCHVRYVYEEAAALLHMPIDQWQHQVNKNLTRVFSQTKRILSSKTLDN
jgi:TatD DNase family protein